MTIQEWKDLNKDKLTECEHETYLVLDNPSMDDFKNAMDSENWDDELSDYFFPVVLNDNALNWNWAYLVSDSGMDLNLKPSKKHPNRLIAWCDCYSDEWELVQSIAIKYDRNTGLNEVWVRIPSENEPIHLYMN